jgi:hypothetical protein
VFERGDFLSRLSWLECCWYENTRLVFSTCRRSGGVLPTTLIPIGLFFLMRDIRFVSSLNSSPITPDGWIMSSPARIFWNHDDIFLLYNYIWCGSTQNCWISRLFPTNEEMSILRGNGSTYQSRWTYSECKGGKTEMISFFCDNISPIKCEILHTFCCNGTSSNNNPRFKTVIFPSKCFASLMGLGSLRKMSEFADERYNFANVFEMLADLITFRDFDSFEESIVWTLQTVAKKAGFLCDSSGMVRIFPSSAFPFSDPSFLHSLTFFTSIKNLLLHTPRIKDE